MKREVNHSSPTIWMVSEWQKQKQENISQRYKTREKDGSKRSFQIWSDLHKAKSQDRGNSDISESVVLLWRQRKILYEAHAHFVFAISDDAVWNSQVSGCVLCHWCRDTSGAGRMTIKKKKSVPDRWSRSRLRPRDPPDPLAVPDRIGNEWIWTGEQPSKRKKYFSL